MLAQTKRIIEHADQYAKDNCGQGIIRKQLSAKLVDACVCSERMESSASPPTNRYQLTIKGVQLTDMLNGFWAASTEDLLKMAV